MKISRFWLQTFFKEPLPSADKLSEGLNFHAFEVEGAEKFGEDDILDVKVTPNRGGDCLSHAGIAREVSAIFKIPLSVHPLGGHALLETYEGLQVEIKDKNLCRRYVAGYMRRVKVGSSPSWLKERLESIGERSINNVVDATNFVMFHLGQPLHAFDARKLSGGKLWVGVRGAREGEKIKTLGGGEYVLPKGAPLIVDFEDAPIGIGGIKGGVVAEVDNETTDLVIESANFNPVSIRKTSRALKLRSEASVRFEQDLSAELASHAARAVADLIVEVAGGEIAGFTDNYPNSEEPNRLGLTTEIVNKVLGSDLNGDEIGDVLSRLHLNFERAGNDVFDVSIPFWRKDLQIPEDLVEEIGRIIGYDSILPQDLAASGTTPAVNPNFALTERAREDLARKGYSEVFTSVFAESGEVEVLNKVGGLKPYLRQTLVPALEDALRKNILIKDAVGVSEVKLFEIGTVWVNGMEKTMLGLGSESEGVGEQELSGVPPTAYEDLPIAETKRYEPFSRYPFVVRDVAFWAPVGTEVSLAASVIKESAGGFLVKEPTLFDKFEKNNQASLAFRLIFQSFERTLNDSEVGEAMKAVEEALSARGFKVR